MLASTGAGQHHTTSQSGTGDPGEYGEACVQVQSATMQSPGSTGHRGHIDGSHELLGASPDDFVQPEAQLGGGGGGPGGGAQCGESNGIAGVVMVWWQ